MVKPLQLLASIPSSRGCGCLNRRTAVLPSLEHQYPILLERYPKILGCQEPLEQKAVSLRIQIPVNKWKPTCIQKHVVRSVKRIGKGVVLVPMGQAGRVEPILSHDDPIGMSWDDPCRSAHYGLPVGKILTVMPGFPP